MNRFMHTVMLAASLLGAASHATEYHEDFSNGDGGWTGYYKFPAGYRNEQGCKKNGCIYADSSARFFAPPALCGDLRSRFGDRFRFEFAISDYYDYGGVAHLSVRSGKTRWQWNRSIDSPPGKWQTWSLLVNTSDSTGWKRVSGTGSFADTWSAVDSLEIVPTRGAGMHFDDVVCRSLPQTSGQPGKDLYALRVTVTDTLTMPRVPLDPTLDFAAIIADHGLPGVIDLGSIRVVDIAAKRLVPHALEGFKKSDSGRVEWVVPDPEHCVYDIQFRTAAVRKPYVPIDRVPRIGTGDLLRYNAGEPRPVTTIYVCGLADLNGDGRRDLVGVWNYAHRPGTPWSGCIMYPRQNGTQDFLFGDMLRLPGLPGDIYMTYAVADLNHDGKPDLVYSARNRKTVRFYLNVGQATTGDCPSFTPAGTLDRGTADWMPVRVADIDGDGVEDLTFGKWRVYSEGTIAEGAAATIWIRNENPNGWPFVAAAPVMLKLGGIQPDWLDLDGDGRLDVVCLLPNDAEPGLSSFTLAWQRNLGGVPPTFSAVRPLTSINDQIWRPTGLAAVRDGKRRGLLVVTRNWQRTEFFQLKAATIDGPKFGQAEIAGSPSAVISASDQAAPFVCDWDGDGDQDLLVGGGYGWPQIILNRGSNQEPAYDEPRLIRAHGKPIRVLRDSILGPPPCWHNMGYLFPAYVDWDADGLPDLMLPNETNRILWYRNTGTRTAPDFDGPLQIIVDGFPDSPELRTASAELVAKSPNVYPTDKSQPFYWRSGAAFLDMNGDGLMDIVDRDWSKYSFGLFRRYRAADGSLRLKRHATLLTADKKPFSGSRCNVLDWDGDGRLDVLFSQAMAKPGTDTVFLARNVGTNTEPVFAPVEPVRCFGAPVYITRHGPHPWAGDLDGDGHPDLLCYVEWSVYPFYSHAALTMPRRPRMIVASVRIVKPDGAGG